MTRGRVEGRAPLLLNASAVSQSNTGNLGADFACRHASVQGWDERIPMLGFEEVDRMKTVQIAIGGLAALVLLGGAFQAGRDQGAAADDVADTVSAAAPGVATASTVALPLKGGADESAAPVAKPKKVSTEVASPVDRPAARPNAPAQTATAATAATAAVAPKLCAECATVVDVHSEHREGKASGLGAVGGALLGGVLGHQVGGGTGKKIATVAGAAAGGFAGNSVEKSQTAREVWMVRVSYPDGDKRSFEFDHRPDFRVNTVVRVRDGVLERY